MGRLVAGLLCDLSWCHPLILTTATVTAAALPALGDNLSFKRTFVNLEFVESRRRLLLVESAY